MTEVTVTTQNQTLDVEKRINSVLVEEKQLSLEINLNSVDVVTAGVQGPAGPQGEDGPAGEDGSDGADGEGVPTGGTEGQVLAKVSATDFDTQWEDPGGGAWALLQEQVVSEAVTTVDFIDLDTATYKVFKLVFYGAAHNDGSANYKLAGRISKDNGASWITQGAGFTSPYLGNYGLLHTGGTSFPIAKNVEDYWIFSSWWDGAVDAPHDPAHGEILFYGFGLSGHPHFLSKIAHYWQGTWGYSISHGVFYDQAVTVNAFQLFLIKTAGTDFTAGTFRLYGLNP